MIEEIGFEFRLRKIDETRNYILDEIKHNDSTSEKYKNTVSTVIGCVSISSFAFLVCVPVGITISTVELKILQTLQELKSISQL